MSTELTCWIVRRKQRHSSFSQAVPRQEIFYDFSTVAEEIFYDLVRRMPPTATATCFQ